MLFQIGISHSYIRAIITCFDMQSLSSIQKTRQQVNECVKYFNFVQKKRRHGNFKGEDSYLCIDNLKTIVGLKSLVKYFYFSLINFKRMGEDRNKLPFLASQLTEFKVYLLQVILSFSNSSG